jgi:hypothetical protein
MSDEQTTLITRLARPAERARYGLPPIEWFPHRPIALREVVSLGRREIRIPRDVWDTCVHQWAAVPDHVDLGVDPASGHVILAPGLTLTVHRLAHGSVVLRSDRFGAWWDAHHVTPGRYPVRLEEDWLVVLCGRRKEVRTDDLAEREQ